MAITLVGVPVSGSSVNGGNAVLNFPAGVQENDMVILFGGFGGSSGNNLTPVTAGYQLITGGTSPSPRVAIHYKLMAAVPDASVTARGAGVSTDATAYVAYVIRGLDLADFFHQVQSNTSTDPPPLTIAPPADSICLVFTARSTILTPTGPPPGYSNLIHTSGNDTNDIHVAGATKVISAVDDPGPFGGWGEATNRSFTMALNPDAGGEPPPPPDEYEPFITEDFEDATLNVSFGGTWARTSAQAQAGAWSYRSAVVPDSGGTSDATVVVPDTAAKVQFWYRVSSESGYDFFRFLNNGSLVISAAGESGWVQSDLITVVPGQTLTFRYFKDTSVSEGADAGYIDNLVFHRVVEAGGGGPSFDPRCASAALTMVA